MKITSKGRYAVLAMVDIASHSTMSPCNLTHVSIRQNISLPYLERIFNDLKKANLVESQKGPGGGYRLSKNSDQIRILEILNAIDEKIKATGCSNNPNASFFSYHDVQPPSIIRFCPVIYDASLDDK